VCTVLWFLSLFYIRQKSLYYYAHRLWYWFFKIINYIEEAFTYILRVNTFKHILWLWRKKYWWNYIRAVYGLECVFFKIQFFGMLYFKCQMSLWLIWYKLAKMLLHHLERWNLRWISTDRSSQYYHWNKTMKLTLTLITIVVGMLLIEESSPIKSS